MPDDSAEMQQNGSTAELLCEHFRLTVFPVPSPVGFDAWWQDVMQELPETTVSQPRKGEHKDEGPFLKGALVLHMQQGRVDWIARPRPGVDAEENELGLLNIGTFATAFSEFSSHMRRWLAKAPTTARMAFGGAALLPVKDRATGYVELAKMLPLLASAIDPDGSRDFLYQINRPKRSQVVTHLDINRIGKWSVNASTHLKVSLSGGAIEATPGLMSYNRRVEFDVNTSQENIDPLPHDRLGELFDELTAMALELVNDGDQR